MGGKLIRVISDKVHRLLVTLSFFRPDRFVQLISLIPILILLLYLLVSIDLVLTGLCELVLGVYPGGEQLFSKRYWIFRSRGERLIRKRKGETSKNYMFQLPMLNNSSCACNIS